MSALVTGAQNSVVFWEEKSLTRRRSAQPFPDSDYHISSLSWSARNNKLAVVPKWGDRVAVCDLQDDILTWSHLVHKDGGAFTCGCLLNNSRYLASGCGNSSVLVWDLKHKNVVRTLQGHSGAVSSVTVTSNDHQVVSGGQDGHIFLHPVSSSSKMKTVQLTKDQTSPQVRGECGGETIELKLRSDSNNNWPLLPANLSTQSLTDGAVSPRLCLTEWGSIPLEHRFSEETHNFFNQTLWSGYRPQLHAQ